MSDPASAAHPVISDGTLERAVADGLISATQRDGLLQLASAETAAPSVEDETTEADEEKFRVLGGFNDILVTIGLMLLIGGFFSLSYVTGAGGLTAFLAAPLAWLLAEFFTRRLRLALPSIALSAMFVGAAVLSVATAFDLAPFASTRSLMIVSIAGIAAALAHYRRFLVPIDIAIAACCGVELFCSAIGSSGGLLAPQAPLITLPAGLVVFALAMAYDLRDPLRRSRQADIAFWLHLVAAPTIVHSVIGLLPFRLLSGSTAMQPAFAAAIFALFLVFSVIALVIDRRAMLVSALVYAGLSLSVLVRGLTGNGSLTVPATLLALAALVLAVSAGWQSLRRLLVPLMPLGHLAKRLPPLRGQVPQPKQPT